MPISQLLAFIRKVSILHSEFNSTEESGEDERKSNVIGTHFGHATGSPPPFERLKSANGIKIPTKVMPQRVYAKCTRINCLRFAVADEGRTKPLAHEIRNTKRGDFSHAIQQMSKHVCSKHILFARTIWCRVI